MKLMLKVFCLVNVLYCFLVSNVLSQGIREVIGMNVDCGTSGCQNYPLNVTVLCAFPTTCPKMITVDWTNENRLYGLDGSDCFVSNNKGATWTVCGPRPWTQSGKYHIAVTKNGSLIVTGNDPGFTIFRSTNGGSTWSIVFSSTSFNDIVTVTKGKLHCSKVNDYCAVVVDEPLNPNRTAVFTSIDDGITWTKTNLASTDFANGSMSVNDELTNGIIGVSFPNGTSFYRSVLLNGSTWSLGSTWPSIPSGCIATYIMNGNKRAICRVGTFTTTLDNRDENGVSLNSFTLSGIATSGAYDYLAISARTNAIWVVGANPSNLTSVWVSIDGGISFSLLTTLPSTNMSFNQIGSIMTGLDGCIYASWNSVSTGTVIKIC